MILSSSIINADTDTKKEKSMLYVYNVMLWRHKLLDLDGDMVKAEVPETYKVNTDWCAAFSTRNFIHLTISVLRNFLKSIDGSIWSKSLMFNA